MAITRDLSWHILKESARILSFLQYLYFIKILNLVNQKFCSLHQQEILHSIIRGDIVANILFLVTNLII